MDFRKQSHMKINIGLGLWVNSQLGHFTAYPKQIQLEDKAWRPWGIPTQECVKCSLK